MYPNKHVKMHFIFAGGSEVHRLSEFLAEQKDSLVKGSDPGLSK